MPHLTDPSGLALKNDVLLPIQSEKTFFVTYTLGATRMNLRNLKSLVLLVLSIFFIKASLAGNLAIEHLDNAGIKITTDNQTVLIDALHSPSHRSTTVEKATLKQLPSTSADIVLVTNASSEHFSPKLVSGFMLNNPDAILIGTQKVVRKMHGMFNKHRTMSPKLRRFESVKYQYAGIKVTVMNTPLSDPNRQKYTQNNAFLVEIGDFNVLHVGQSEVTNTLKNLTESSNSVDLAIIPDACIMSEKCVHSLTQMDIENIAFTHTLRDETDNITRLIQAKLPHAHLLTKANNRLELGSRISLSSTFQKPLK
jgi:L-ascorbate metabolism protein UlaG (beta-lactamase superfamily)